MFIVFYLSLVWSYVCGDIFQVWGQLASALLPLLFPAGGWEVWHHRFLRLNEELRHRFRTRIFERAPLLRMEALLPQRALQG